MSENEKLTKVHVDLPNHWATGGESMWALDLGDDLYELRNVPFHAYNLNFGDVVRATADSPELKPEVRSVARRSGNRTLRVIFMKEQSEATMLELLHSLKPMAVSFERANQRYFALDLEPEADIDRVRDVLDEWERQGWAEYETCEEKVPGSFDAAPGEGEEEARLWRSQQWVEADEAGASHGPRRLTQCCPDAGAWRWSERDG
jgi:hypothetical protein